MEELGKIFGGSEDLSENVILKEIMAEVDKDGDNEISYEEFNNAVTFMLRGS